MKYAESNGWTDDEIAVAVAASLDDGWYVNLGIGLPTRVADMIGSRPITIHTENGILGVGPHAAEEDIDRDQVNAGKEYITLVPGASFFSQAESFAMVRAGYIDAVVMGAYQVSQQGDLSNWKRPGQEFGSIGGAMDLAVGARRVYVMMHHVAPDGQPKLVSNCTYPLTAVACVTKVFTDLGVFVPSNEGFVVERLAADVGLDHARALTDGRLIFPRKSTLA